MTLTHLTFNTGNISKSTELDLTQAALLACLPLLKSGLHSIPQSHGFYVQTDIGDQVAIFTILELNAILETQAAKNNGQKPLVRTVTDEEKQATLAALREEIEASKVQDVEVWIESLCKSGSSDVWGCDWDAVVKAIGK